MVIFILILLICFSGGGEPKQMTCSGGEGRPGRPCLPQPWQSAADAVCLGRWVIAAGQVGGAIQSHSACGMVQAWCCHPETVSALTARAPRQALHPQEGPCGGAPGGCAAAAGTAAAACAHACASRRR